MKTATKLAPKRAGSHKGLNGASKIRIVPKKPKEESFYDKMMRERREEAERERLETIRKRDFPTPQELAEKLANKKQMLECRRWNIVLEEVLEAIKKSKAADVTVDLIDLIVVFGTSFRRSPSNHSSKRGEMWPWLDAASAAKPSYPTEAQQDKDWSFQPTMHRISKNGESDRSEALWAALKPVISDQLRGFRLVSDIIKSKVDEDIRRVGALIDYPVQARKCTANFTLRVPKAWGKGLDIHTLEPIAAATTDGTKKRGRK